MSITDRGQLNAIHAFAVDEPRTFTIDPSGNFIIVGNMMNIVRMGAYALQ